MILEEKVNRVSQEGFGQSIALRMEANAIGFRILIKNIYTDEVSAIVRELGTNALESHIAAGNTEPFHVQVPTYRNPNFVIRDFGTGITPEAMAELYSVMFRSDKRDSNEVNGCFGIGSKSPYAYSDNFNLESYVGGKRYIYACFIDPHGMPHISPVAGTENGIETDEPNGVKITIPVRNNDISVFENRARQIYRYFRNKPKCNIDIGGVRYSNIGGEKWKLREDGTNVINVVMGDVAYKLNTVDKLRQFGTLISQPIDIFVNIGDVSIDSGRERIVADEKTIKCLTERLNGIQDDCRKHIEKELEDSKSLWDLKIAASAIANTFMAGLAKEVTWNGTKYSLYNLTNDFYLRQQLDENEGLDLWQFRYGVKRKLNLQIKPVKDMRLVHLDKCVASHVRCANLSKDGTIVVALKCTDETFDKLIKHMGAEAYACKASSLDRGPIVKRDYARYRSVTSLYDSSGRSLESFWKKEPDFDFEDGGYYVIVDRGSVLIGEARIHPSKLVDALGYLGIKDKIYGISKSTLKDFEESDDWESAATVIKTAMMTKWNKENFARVRYYSEKVQHNRVEAIKKISRVLKDKVKNPIITLVDGASPGGEITAMNRLNNLHVDLFGEGIKADISPQIKSDIEKIGEALDKFDKKYPLLPYLSLNFMLTHQKESHDALAQYLNS